VSGLVDCARPCPVLAPAAEHGEEVDAEDARLLGRARHQVQLLQYLRGDARARRRVPDRSGTR
jgi:hypothetical protein